MAQLVQDYNDGAQPLARYQRRQESLGLYFLFTDNDLPPDTNKRIYLFGAIFKIMTDLRILLFTGLIIGIPFSIAFAGNRYSARNLPHLELNGSAVTSVALIAIVVAILGMVGWVKVRQEELSFERSTGKTLQRPSAKEIILPGLVLVGLMAASVLIAIHLRGQSRYLCLVPAVLAVLFWFGIEVGPPREVELSEGVSPFEDGIHDPLFRMLRVRNSAAPQFPIWYRTTTDLAVIVPALVGATVACTWLARSSESVLAWSILIVPAVLIMTVHKHEARLMGAYSNQLAYLDLAQGRIRSALSKRDGL